MGIVRNLYCALGLALLVTLFPGGSLLADTEREVAVENPASDLWRAVRQREAPMIGNTSSNGVAAGQLINPAGQDWRNLRRDKVIPWAGWALVGAACVVALLFLVRPSTPIPHGGSGLKIRRLDAIHRYGHWLMAILMLLLAITGILLLTGRYALLPWMGSEVFSTMALFSRNIHHWVGPVFVFSLVVFFLLYVAKNLPTLVDLKWLLKLGGLFSEHTPPAGFFNAGEKILFWLVILFGTALSASGILLQFKGLLPDREMMQLVLVVHAGSAIGLTALVFGHIYMAVSVKGTMDAIISGDVDENWASHHHPLWYEQKTGKKAMY